MADSLFDLLLPATCLWCQAAPALLCQECVSTLPAAHIPLVRGDTERPFRGAAFTQLDSRASSLLHEVKDRHQTAFLRALGKPMAASFDFWLSELGLQSARLVPIPASAHGWRSRGFNVAELIARELFRHSRFSLELSRVLGYAREVDDQRALNAGQRAENLSGAFEVVRPSRFKNSPPIVIVDDVVTTGATILAARAALDEGGFPSVGFFGFAETFLKNAPRSSKWV
ncbi:MAG: ComF family protein [Micrococcales bacterium]